MQEAEAGQRHGVAGGGGDVLPALVGGDEALGRGGAGVDHGVAVKAAEAGLAAGGRVADGLHRPCSVRSTLSALMARGMPVYGAV